MSVPLSFWWAVLMLISISSTLKTSDPDHKDVMQKDIGKDNDLLHSFYLAVEKALPELQELRSSFQSLREQYNHFQTLDDMLANFGQPQDEHFKEDLEEEQGWKESTKAWIRDIETNMAKNGVSLNISKLEPGVKTTTKEEKSKKQEEQLEKSLQDRKLGKDSSTGKEKLPEPEALVIQKKVKDKLNDESEAATPATNSNSKDKDNQDIKSDPFSEKYRPKRSLEENQEEQPEPRVMPKHKRQMLDDFEDHNGNRASFGVLGNGMLTPDAEESGGKSQSFPNHELLSRYNDLEGSHDYESLAQIYDPTKNEVPLINQRSNSVSPQQQPVAQPQQQQPRSSHFKASFNLNNIFKDLQKQQSRPAAPPPQAPQPVQQPPPANPVPVQQPIQQYRQQVPVPVYRYLGPFSRKPQQKLNVDPNCVPITVMPPNCITSSPAAATPSPTASDATTATTSAGATTSGTATTEIGDACNNPDAMKVNVAINANVCADPKTKLFSGNGSISVVPAPQKLYSEENYKIQDAPLRESEAKLDERHIRDVTEVLNEGVPGQEWELKREQKQSRRLEAHAKPPTMMKLSGKKAGNSTRKQTTQKAAPKTPDNIRKNTTKCERPEKIDCRPTNYDKLISGKLSEEIVDAVFEAIGCDPEMERLVSVLQRNRQRPNHPRTFYQIRTDKTENYVRQTEGMVRDAMLAISEIIDQQISRRACVPLRPDLVEFYELILKTSEEEKKVREKRQSSLQVLSADFSEDVRLLDPGKINEKTRIVKKLLQQYEELPLGDQLAAAKTHDELLLDLEYLRKMADTVERRKRRASLSEVVKQQTLDKVLEEHVNSEYSPRFIKLLKTADLFLESGATLAKDRI